MDLVTTPRPLPARYRRAERTAAAASFVRSVDWILVVAVAALVGYGLWAIGGITSATSANICNTGTNFYQAIRHPSVRSFILDRVPGVSQR